MKQVNLTEQGCELSGPLTFDTVAVILQKLRPLIKSQDHFVVNLSGVTKSDSASLALMTALLRQGKKVHAIVQFTHIPVQLKDVMRVGGLDRILSVNS